VEQANNRFTVCRSLLTKGFALFASELTD